MNMKPGRELDFFVYKELTETFPKMKKMSRFLPKCFIPRYSTDLNQAMKVLDIMGQHMFLKLEFRGGRGYGWNTLGASAEKEEWETSFMSIPSTAGSKGHALPETICLALLKFMKKLKRYEE